MAHYASVSHSPDLWAHLPGFYWVVDRDAKLVAISYCYLELIGETQVPAPGEDVMAFFQDKPYASLVNGTEALTQVLEKVRHTGQEEKLPSQGTLRVTSEPPRFFDLLYLPVKDDNAETAYIIHQAVEVTAPQKANRREEQFRHLVESCAQVIWTTDASGLIVEDSPSWRAFTGQTFEECKGEGWLDAVHPDDRAFAKANWYQTVKAEKKVEASFRIQHVSGEWRWTAVHAVPLFHPDGSLQSYLGINLDITEQKKVEEGVRRSEALLRNAIEIETVGIIFFKADGPITFANEAFLNMSGYTQEDMQNGLVRWDVQTPPEFMAQSQHAIHEFLTTGRTTPYEKQYIRKDGSRWWALFAAARINEEEGVEFVIDIDERKQAEQASRQSEEHLQLIMESSVDFAIFTMDMDRKVIDWNAGAERLLGYSKEEIIGQSGDLIFVPEDRETQPDNEMHIAMKKGRAKNERWHLRKDGSRFWGSGLTMPLRSTDHQLRGFLKIMRDNTERKQMEESLKQTKEEAEQAAKAKEDFLAHMSHEIRTPLNAIVGLSHLLLHQKPKQEQLENLQTLKFSAENLMILINDILDFSKIQAGKVEIENIEVNLHELLHSLQKAHQFQATDKGNALEFHIDNKIPKTICTDQLKLSQILHNLVSNAVKFTHQGLIVVEVSLQHQKGKQLWIDFSISDTGIGIPQEKLSSIFDTFTQADTSTVRQYGGTGLGLSITKLLLELMGSQIQVESQPGQGSRFFFTLPVKKSTARRTITDQSAHDPKKQINFAQLKMLLVEDADINRMIFKQFLYDWWGIIPDEATDGEQAIEMAQKKRYDLILMDLHMPLLDGYQATQSIRNSSDDYYKKVPIIALTADTPDELLKHPEASLFTDVITKPFDPVDLRQKLVHHAPEKKVSAVASSINIHQNMTETAKPGSDLQEMPLQITFDKMETFFKGNSQNMIKFLETGIQEFHLMHEKFDDAMIRNDAQALSSLKHKAEVLINMLGLEDLKEFLQHSLALLEEKADATEQERAREEGKHKIRQIVTSLEERLAQIY